MPIDLERHFQIFRVWPGDNRGHLWVLCGPGKRFMEINTDPMALVKVAKDDPIEAPILVMDDGGIRVIAPAPRAPEIHSFHPQQEA